ncbi:hypothetical protein BD413DRAFT_631990 [Trametes elegans]|nr:hypothetical protein BD413DRAFT_631990 [Trametes elegans]
MAPEIRFNAFGIPYLVEFAQVTFRSRSLSSSRSSSRASTRPTLASRRDPSDSRPALSLRPTASRSTIDSDWTLAARTASSESLATLVPAPAPAHPSMRLDKAPAMRLDKALPEPEPEPECPSTEEYGLYIRCASQLARPPRRLSDARLARLKYRIARAVMAAGMDTSPAGEPADPLASTTTTANTSDGGAARVSVSSIRSEDVETEGLPGSLFRGTYGQVMTALRAAGLATVPCHESGVHDATRLGALFVAHANDRGGVEFTKLTLWA